MKTGQKVVVTWSMTVLLICTVVVTVYSEPAWITALKHAAKNPKVQAAIKNPKVQAGVGASGLTLADLLNRAEVEAKSQPSGFPSGRRLSDCVCYGEDAGLMQLFDEPKCRSGVALPQRCEEETCPQGGYSYAITCS